VIWDAAKGLDYLHERGIVHGDLKGNSILVCDGIAKLADFGLSAFAMSAREDSSGALGAFRWKAPECLAGSGPTFASDIYSFAMCIVEVISEDFPWGK
jgi:serine/threonine protein kinase